MEDFIFNLCKMSGNILLKYFGKDLNRQEKIDAGFVTHADIESENYIINTIRASFPESDILAEESGEDVKGYKRKWIIDPLDGTTNFACNIPFFAISIALEEEGMLTYGGVYNPVTDEFFYSEKGKGMFFNGKRVKISSGNDLPEAVFSTGDYYYRGEKFRRSMEIFNKIYEASRVVRVTGSVALSLAYVASGKMDGFWMESFNYWDVAPGILMVEEGGGRVTDFHGHPVKKGSSIIAANNKLLSELLPVLSNGHDRAGHNEE